MSKLLNRDKIKEDNSYHISRIANNIATLGNTYYTETEVDNIVSALKVDFTFKDEAKYHWTEAAAITINGAWHDLDVSAECAANEIAVFELYVKDNAVNLGGYLREDGATNNFYTQYVLVANGAYTRTVILNVGATQIIEYKGDTGLDRLRIQHMGVFTIS